MNQNHPYNFFYKLYEEDCKRNTKFSLQDVYQEAYNLVSEDVKDTPESIKKKYEDRFNQVFEDFKEKKVAQKEADLDLYLKLVYRLKK